MNLRAPRALVRHTWTAWMASRSFYFILAFGWMVPPLIYLFVWSMAAGEGAVGGMTRDTFITYYLALIVTRFRSVWGSPTGPCAVAGAPGTAPRTPEARRDDLSPAPEPYTSSASR